MSNTSSQALSAAARNRTPVRLWFKSEPARMVGTLGWISKVGNRFYIHRNEIGAGTLVDHTDVCAVRRVDSKFGDEHFVQRGSDNLFKAVLCERLPDGTKCHQWQIFKNQDEVPTFTMLTEVQARMIANYLNGISYTMPDSGVLLFD